MKYVKISNEGLIDPAALHYVGASTKRNDSTKIGQFGSGNKYALAFLLRSDYELKVFSGKNEIQITTKPVMFRGQEFNVIHIDGEKTSITTEMGKDWAFWQAIREIYCNAIDEGKATIEYVNSFEPEDNQTHFYISRSKEANEFMSNFDNYFSVNKKVLFECEVGRILEKTGDKANLYRKGIRCYEPDTTSVFDYDFNDLRVGEDRLASYHWQIHEKMWDLISRCDDKEVIMQVLHNSYSSDFIESSISDIATINFSKASDAFKDCMKEIRTCPSGMAGMLNPDEVHSTVIIPTKVFQAARGFLSNENVADSFRVHLKGGLFRVAEKTPLFKATLSKAMDFLEEVRFEIPYEIEMAQFDSENVLGCAHDGKIYLSEKCAEMGVNETVNAIIEEYIHLKHRVKDNTRAFQTAAITEFIAYMKRSNSYVL